MSDRPRRPRMQRNGFLQAAAGNSRGSWMLVDHPLILNRTDDGWKFDSGPLVLGWLAEHQLDQQLFARRADALDALAVAVDADPPDWRERSRQASGERR